MFIRLGWEEKIGETVDAEVILPAVGQGALGIEVRQDDRKLTDLVAVLTDEVPRSRERPPSVRCSAPLKVDARCPSVHLAGSCGPEGRSRCSGSMRWWVRSTEKQLSGERSKEIPQKPTALGRQLAARLLADGAEEILRQIRSLQQDVNKLEA